MTSANLPRHLDDDFGIISPGRSTMSLQFIAVFVAMMLLLGGCAAARSDRAAGVDELERRHADTVRNLGGSGM